MQLEIDILKETINVLKKGPGVSKVPLKNKEKAAIADALKDRYTLPILLGKLEMAKSSYYYQENRLNYIDNIRDYGIRSARSIMITELAMATGAFMLYLKEWNHGF